MTRLERSVLIATVLGSGIVFLDGTVVNVALPHMGQELPSSVFGVLEAQSYLYNAYFLSLAALLIAGGALADRFGRKRLYVLGLWGFAASSALCGVAPNMEVLILARFLQGVAGALLIPNSLALLRTVFAEQDQPQAIGAWSAASAATTLLGPVLGGTMVDVLSWRWAFLINVPLVAVAVLVLAAVPESKAAGEGSSARLDVLGAVVAALAVGGLAFGLTRGQEREWRDALAWVALMVGVVAAVCFPVLMRRPNALVPPALFGNRNFVVVNLATFVIYGALYVSGYVQNLFFQGTLGYTALAAGLAGLPAGILLSLFSARVGALAGRVGARVFLVAGPLCMALGALLLSGVPVNSSPWQASLLEPGSLLPSSGFWVHVLPGSLLFAVGLTLMVAPLTSTLMTSVPAERAGLGSAINNAVSRVGPQLLGALAFIAITSGFEAGVERRGVVVTAPVRLEALNRPPESLAPAAQLAVRESSAEAFRVALWLCAACLFVGAGLGLAVESRKPD